MELLFDDVQTLPLFAQTPVHVKAKPAKPQPDGQQTTWATCKTCQDTGRVGTRYCWCEAGDKARAAKRDK